MRGRQSTYDAFMTAVKTARKGDLPLLLVDAEEAVAAGHTVWQHLKSHDNWDRPAGTDDEQAFLMVQVMETWFLADKEMLTAYFGAGFAEKHLHAWPSLEDVPKQTVYDALEKATARCKQKAYAKGRVCFEILERLDPLKIEKACPHARVLLDYLRSI